MGKNILKNIKFKYNDCNDYKFTIKVNDDNKSRADLYIYRKKSIKFHKYTLFNYYYRIIYNESFGNIIHYRTIKDYSSIIIENVNNYKKTKTYDHIQNLFINEFDGYIGFSEDEMKLIKRGESIKNIIK